MNQTSSALSSHWPLSVLSSATSVITMLLPLLLVRILPAPEIGAFKIFFLYLMLFPQLSLAGGLINGISYWAGRGDAGAKVLSLTAVLIVALALLSALLVWGTAPALESWLGFSHQEMLLFAFAVAVTIPNSLFEELSISQGAVWHGAIFSSGFDLFRSLAMVGAAIFFGTLDTVLVAYVVSIGIKSLMGFFWSIRVGYIANRIEYGEIGSVLRYALPVAIAGILGIIVGYADQLLLTGSLSRAEFALYAIGCLILPPLFAIEYSIVRVLIPQLGRSLVSGSEQAARLYRHAVQELGFIMIPATIGLVVFAEPIVSLLFTESYSAAASYLELFALTYLLLIIPYDAIARARGDSIWILRTFSFFSVMTLLCAWLGLSLMGARGALIGVLISRLGMKAYAVLQISRSESWGIREFLPLKSLSRYLLLGLALGLVARLSQPLFASELSWLLVCGTSFGVLYLVGVCLWKESAPITLRPRVLLLTQCLRIGGLEKMVLSLCLGLKRQAIWDISVFSYDQGESVAERDLLPEFNRHGIELEHFEKPEGFSPGVVFRLVQHLSERGINVIHSHDLGGLIYGALAKLFAPYRVRLVHTQHSFVHLSSENRRYSLYEFVFSRFVDELVVVSEETKQGYVKLGVVSDRIHVVENGVSVCEEPIIFREARIAERKALIKNLQDLAVAEQLAGESTAIWLMQLARLHPVKGQRHTLELWRALPQEARRKCLLLIVGPEAEDGELANLEKRIETLPDRERVILCGGTNQPQHWLRAVDIFISGSESEGLPLGPLEALAAGLPCFLSEVSGHSFLSSVSVQFSLQRPDIGAARLLALMAEVVNPEATFIKQQEIAAHWVRANFSLEQMTNRYSQLYLEPNTRQEGRAPLGQLALEVLR